MKFQQEQKVFDWTIPKEWNIDDAYIISPDGKKICDFKKNNLHVVNYSIPVDKEVDYDELFKHIHTLNNQPNAIPYITSYYNETWGFCISKKELDKLPKKGKYRVFIKSTLENGSITYGDLVLRGESKKKEILFSTYLCHPSMANNELSGPLCLAFLYQKIKQLKRKYTYRFIVAPETIGTIAYLSKYGMDLKDNLHAEVML